MSAQYYIIPFLFGLVLNGSIMANSSILINIDGEPILLQDSKFEFRNELKGRIFPTGKLFSIGFGYERYLNARLGLQVTGNYYGRDFRPRDGTFIGNANIVPELRFYWCEKCRNPKLWFFGFYTEVMKVNYKYSGESSLAQNGATPVDYVEHQVNPGILLGKKFKLTDAWYFEIFSGLKYRFGKRTSNFTTPTTTFNEKCDHRSFGTRFGLNISFRF